MEAPLNFSSHRVFGFVGFKLAFGELASRCIDDLASSPNEDREVVSSRDYDRHAPKPVASWLPEKLLPAARGRYAKEKLLQEVDSVRGAGLHLSVQRLLSGELKDRCRTYELSDRALDLFNKGDLYDEIPREDRHHHQLALVLNPSVKDRIDRLSGDARKLFRTVSNAEGKAKFILPIRIIDLCLYHFETDRVVCQLALEANLPDTSVISSAALAEIVDICGRFPSLGWLKTTPQVVPAKDDSLAEVLEVLIEPKDFTIGSMLARIVQGAQAKASRSHRTFTHAFGSVALDQPQTSFERIHEIAARLARQYNSDYQMRQIITDEGTVADFDNVVHVVSREGGATIIDPRTHGAPVEYLRNFLTNSIEPNYLPILVLNLHQHFQATELAAVSVLETRGPDAIPDDAMQAQYDRDRLAENVKQWRRLQEQLANLHLRFRFRQISPITMHNRFNSALRRSFGLDELESQLRADLDEMSRLVQTRATLLEQGKQNTFRKQFGWVAAVVTGTAACVAWFEITTALNQFLEDGLQVWEQVTLLLVLPIAAIAAAWGSHKFREHVD